MHNPGGFVPVRCIFSHAPPLAHYGCSSLWAPLGATLNRCPGKGLTCLCQARAPETRGWRGQMGKRHPQDGWLWPAKHPGQGRASPKGPNVSSHQTTQLRSYLQDSLLIDPSTPMLSSGSPPKPCFPPWWHLHSVGAISVHSWPLLSYKCVQFKNFLLSPVSTTVLGSLESKRHVSL